MVEATGHSGKNNHPKIFNAGFLLQFIDRQKLLWIAMVLQSLISCFVVHKPSANHCCQASIEQMKNKST